MIEVDSDAVHAFWFGRFDLAVIVRFGRFPHRNAVLGRESTRGELEELDFAKRTEPWR